MVLLGDEQRALDFSQQLQARGFLVGAIRPPTVPKGSARLRFTFSATHSQADIERLLLTIDQVSAEQGVKNGY